MFSSGEKKNIVSWLLYSRHVEPKRVQCQRNYPVKKSTTCCIQLIFYTRMIVGLMEGTKEFSEKREKL